MIVTGIHEAVATNWRQPITESDATNNAAPRIAQVLPVAIAAQNIIEIASR